MLAPGATIGIVGGGQLGRMLSVAAAQLGYRCHIYDPHESPPAAEVACHFTRGAFDDVPALKAFAAKCDVVTYEFENLPAAELDAIEGLKPSTKSLEMSQDRATEKEFIERCGGKPAKWMRVDSAEDARRAVDELGLPFVLKTRRMGYDGKGQAWVRKAGDAEAAFAEIGEQPAVAEAGVDFSAEFSVIIARRENGQTAIFDCPQNRHENGILRQSVLPASADIVTQLDEARHVAAAMAEALGHVGVMTVEFFATADGPLVNEFAPRVHNSGHWTIEGAATSQFEQHIRAILDLPLGDPRTLVGGVVMDNIIGDEADDWESWLREPGASLHLYGKGEARPGRKMGHVTRLK